MQFSYIFTYQVFLPLGNPIFSARIEKRSSEVKEVVYMHKGRGVHIRNDRTPQEYIILVCCTVGSHKAQYKGTMEWDFFPDQVLSGSIKVELSFVSSFAFKNLLILLEKKICKNDPNNNPQHHPVFCNPGWNVPVQELLAPSETLGKGQLPARCSSQAREYQEEPLLSLLCVPRKAGAGFGKLQKDFFLSLCCCCAGCSLKPGRKKESVLTSKQT